MTSAPFHIVFVIYSGMTQLDFTGPHQFLSRLPNGKVTVASVNGGDVHSEGLVFAGTQALLEVTACDLLCVPGGRNALDVALDPVLIEHLRRLAVGAQYVTSVCTGSLILGAAGLLKGRRAACHWAWRELLPMFGAIPDESRVARDGNIITGGGVTAGIDFALTVLAELAGDEHAQAVQLGLEYAPDPPFDAGTPKSAPAHIVELYRQGIADQQASRQAQAKVAAAHLGLTL